MISQKFHCTTAFGKSRGSLPFPYHALPSLGERRLPGAFAPKGIKFRARYG
jgi:hypothetical protein